MTVVYREFAPDRRLRPFVECGWVRSGSAAPAIRVMPDGCVDLFVTADGEVMVAGPATTFYDLPAATGSMLAGLRLRPGAAAAVIGQSANEFRDTLAPIASVFGAAGRQMAENLLDTTTPKQRITLFQDLLAAYFADVEPVLDRPIVRAIQMLRMRPDLPVSALAADFGFSERQLRRRFEAAVGYGPKRLGRIFRFQRLLDLIHVADSRVRWAELAVAAGYADQSHMINESVALAGAPPTALPGGPLDDMSVSSNTAKDGSP